MEIDPHFDFVIRAWYCVTESRRPAIFSPPVLLKNSSRLGQKQTAEYI